MAEQEHDTTPSGQALRAAPRVVTAVVGIVMIALDPQVGIVFAVGMFVLASALSTRPTTWWHYVRTGAKPRVPSVAEVDEVADRSAQRGRREDHDR